MYLIYASSEELLLTKSINECTHHSTATRLTTDCRLRMLRHLGGFVLPEDGSLPRIIAWHRAILERPSVQQTVFYDKDPDGIRQVRFRSAVVYHSALSAVFKAIMQLIDSRLDVGLTACRRSTRRSSRPWPACRSDSSAMPCVIYVFE